MPIYGLIEYSDNHSKTSESLWEYCRDEPVLNNVDIAEFNANNTTTELVKFKKLITH